MSTTEETEEPDLSPPNLRNLNAKFRNTKIGNEKPRAGSSNVSSDRAQLAEKLSLDLARRLREAELRASKAEEEKANTEERLAGLRRSLCRRFELDYDMVHDGADHYEGFVKDQTPSFWGVCRYGELHLPITEIV
eukprot:1194047-Prorocentrum_minimum.AAC.2